MLILLVTFASVRTHYIDDLRNQLFRIAGVLALEAGRLIPSKGNPSLEDFVRSVERQEHLKITVVYPGELKSYMDKPEFAMAVERGEGWSLRYSGKLKEVLLYVALPVKVNGEVVAYIRVGQPLKGIDALLKGLMFDIGKASFLVVLMALLVSLLVSKEISLPMSRLISLSKRIAEGNVGEVALMDEEGELKELSDALNEMSLKLKELFEKLSARERELETVIGSMSEALSVLSSDGRILLCNASFEELFGKAAGKIYWEVVDSLDISEALEEALFGKNVSRQVCYKGRHFLLTASPVPEDRVVLVLHDITSVKELEQVKRDLVAAVSHELKTPLTVIRGYLETLEDAVDGEALAYVKVLKKHAERLGHIVRDLLVLSELEYAGKEALSVEDVDASRLVENVFSIFKTKAEEKGLSIKAEVEEGMVFKGDPYRIEQALVNLVDNAIRYTEKGEVIIRAYRKGGWAVFEVEDTGVGIPEEHQRRIFERFYVVDKSRSRETGGTGLGLSIVKHIVELHGGRIELKSATGKGSKFSLLFPLTEN